MDMSVKGRVALVTGASRGIGRAIALALAEGGADIAVNYRREEEAARETVAAIEGMGRKAKAYAAAIDDRAAVTKMVADIEKDFGRIDILVNNAGIASRGKTVAETDPDELERVVRVHALAPHFVSQQVLPIMRRGKRGDIIMISSVATLHMSANGGPYNMGKAAMEALALTLAKEEHRNGIRVNIVAPGLTDTEMGQRLTKARTGGDIRALDANAPYGHVCQPEEVAAVVRFLVSDANTYVNGQKVNLDGGA